MPRAAEAVRGADLVILCVPVGACGAVAEEIGAAPAAGRDRDRCRLGEGRGACATSARSCRKGVHFIPGHPIAGTEHSGPESGFAELFDGRWCVLTPPEGADQAAVEKLVGVLAGVRLARRGDGRGQHHDLVLAITSHVPHLIAYNIVNTARHLERVTDTEVIKFSAGGFRDFTRIAASDPVMWRDVFLNNKEAVLEMLGRFSEDLTALQRAIRFGDGDTLYQPVRRGARDPARHHPGRPGHRPRPISAGTARL